MPNSRNRKVVPKNTKKAIAKAFKREHGSISRGGSSDPPALKESVLLQFKRRIFVGLATTTIPLFSLIPGTTQTDVVHCDAIKPQRISVYGVNLQRISDGTNEIYDEPLRATFTTGSSDVDVMTASDLGDTTRRPHVTLLPPQDDWFPHSDTYPSITVTGGKVVDVTFTARYVMPSLTYTSTDEGPALVATPTVKARAFPPSPLKTIHAIETQSADEL